MRICRLKRCMTKRAGFRLLFIFALLVVFVCGGVQRMHRLAEDKMIEYAGYVEHQIDSMYTQMKDLSVVMQADLQKTNALPVDAFCSSVRQGYFSHFFDAVSLAGNMSGRYDDGVYADITGDKPILCGQVPPAVLSCLDYAFAKERQSFYVGGVRIGADEGSKIIFALPIVYDWRIAALAGVVSQQRMVDMLSAEIPVREGYGVLLDRNLFILSHPDPQYRGLIFEKDREQLNDVLHAFSTGSQIASYGSPSARGDYSCKFGMPIYVRGERVAYIALVMPFWEVYAPDRPMMIWSLAGMLWAGSWILLSCRWRDTKKTEENGVMPSHFFLPLLQTVAEDAGLCCIEVSLDGYIVSIMGCMDFPVELEAGRSVYADLPQTTKHAVEHVLSKALIDGTASYEGRLLCADGSEQVWRWSFYSGALVKEAHPGRGLLVLRNVTDMRRQESLLCRGRHLFQCIHNLVESCTREPHAVLHEVSHALGTDSAALYVRVGGHEPDLETCLFGDDSPMDLLSPEQKRDVMVDLERGAFTYQEIPDGAVAPTGVNGLSVVAAAWFDEHKLMRGFLIYTVIRHRFDAENGKKLLPTFACVVGSLLDSFGDQKDPSEEACEEPHGCTSDKSSTKTELEKAPLNTDSPELTAPVSLCSLEPVISPLPKIQTISSNELILAVDDDVYVLNMISSSLTHSGYRVLSAQSGRDALALFEQHQEVISAMIIDVRMTDMTGPDVYKAMQLIHPGIPVIFCTGFGDDLLAAHEMDQTELHVIHKPFKHAVLIAKLRDVLDVHSKSP
ncbi:MAG: response regulator [Spartobacteria bacterium]|nr:response regulator [Spartobacteria bacterium]